MVSVTATVLHRWRPPVPGGKCDTELVLLVNNLQVQRRQASPGQASCLAGLSTAACPKTPTARQCHCLLHRQPCQPSSPTSEPWLASELKMHACMPDAHVTSCLDVAEGGVYRWSVQSMPALPWAHVRRRPSHSTGPASRTGPWQAETSWCRQAAALCCNLHTASLTRRC